LFAQNKKARFGGLSFVRGEHGFTPMKSHGTAFVYDEAAN